MIFRFSDYTLDIDVDRTREFYSRKDVKTTSEQCTCKGCQNYDKVILQVPAAVLSFLESLGMDPRKPAEVFDVMGQLDENGKIWYAGFYHVCGTIMYEESRLDPRPDAESSAHWNNSHTHKPDPDFPFEVSFEEDIHLLHEAFPTPVLQMEISIRLPCLLPSGY